MKKHPRPRLETAGDVLGRRILAFLLDSVLIALLWVPLFLVGAALGETGFAVLVVIALALALTYAFLLEGLYGYTPGKYLLGLVVVKSDGSDCTIGASILRNLLWVVDSFPAFNLVAVVSILLTGGQRVGDLVADTVVVERQR